MKKIFAAAACCLTLSGCLDFSAYQGNIEFQTFEEHGPKITPFRYE